MASEEKKYTAEFKKKIALQALDQSKKNLDKLSEKHDVPVSVILMWATELEKGGEDVFEETKEKEQQHKIEDDNEADVEITDSRVADSVQHGVMLDQLNIKRLVFWSVFGTGIVIVFVIGLIEMYQYNQQVTQDRVSAESEYYQANQMKREAQEQLNSFGVVNLENGTYRIPIDSAITEIAGDESD
jgi:transposase-like protein